MPYQCKFCDGGNKPVMVLQPLTGGDTAAACDDCVPIASTMLLADSLGVDVEQLYEAVLKEVKRQAAAAARAEHGESASAAANGPAPRRSSTGPRKKAASRAQSSQASSPGGLSDQRPNAATGEADGQHTPG